MSVKEKPISVLLGDPIFKPKHQRAVKLTIDLPPFTAPRTLSTCKHRKKVSPHRFLHEAYENADVSDVFSKSTCEEVTAKNKNAIHVVIKRVLGTPRIYFTKTELSIIMHMYLQLTGLEMRDISQEEMKNFLHSTLGFTSLVSLDGICRAAALMCGGIAPSKKRITPAAFIKTLSILLRGTIDDRAELAFHAIDIDSDGLLRKTVEFRKLLRDSFDAAIAAQNPDMDPEEPSRDAVNILCDKFNCTLTSHVTLKAFRDMCHKEPWLVECLLPCIPEERVNYTFQSLFNTTVNVPSIDNAVQPIKQSLLCFSRRRTTYPQSLL